MSTLFRNALAPSQRSPLPFLLIGGGAVLLLFTTGLASTAVWRFVAPFWPVLLILVGVGLMHRQWAEVD